MIHAMKRTAIVCIALAGAFVLAGCKQSDMHHRRFGYQRPASAFCAWGLE